MAPKPPRNLSVPSHTHCPSSWTLSAFASLPPHWRAHSLGYSYPDNCGFSSSSSLFHWQFLSKFYPDYFKLYPLASPISHCLFPSIDLPYYMICMAIQFIVYLLLMEHNFQKGTDSAPVPRVSGMVHSRHSTSICWMNK